MGKGYHNYMSKKFFHPTNPENMRRVFMAEEKARHEKQKNEEMIAQYRREQDTLEHRAMLGDKKAQMGLSFMYDAPAGLRKAEEDMEEVQDVKFEWQRKYNAPRESWAKGNEEIADQPFGIEVRNTRCIRCHQWGHSNTDRICPLYGQDLTMEPPNPREGQSISALKEQMKEQGLALKQGVLGATGSKGQDLISSSDESDPEAAFLRSLTPKQREKLLKQVAKLKSGKTKKEKKKKSKKTKKHGDSGSSSDSEVERQERRKKHKRKHSSTAEDKSADLSPVKRSRHSSPRVERHEKDRRSQKSAKVHEERQSHRDYCSDRRGRHGRRENDERVDRDSSKHKRFSRSPSDSHSLKRKSKH